MKKPKHADYERAADVIANESSTTAERLAALNELWDKVASVPSAEWVKTMVDEKLKIATGYTLAEIIEFAKEKKANGTNEAQTAATDAE